MSPLLMIIVPICKSASRLINRLVVPNRWCGFRNHSGKTPSSATRFKTPFAPMIAVFTAPDKINTPTRTTNP